MKTWKDTFVFNYPWEVVVQAAYSKYPNSYNTNVKGLDTLERRVCDRSLYSHRIFTTLWNVPPIVLQIIGFNPLMYVNEQSQCEVERKTLTIAGRNLSLRHLFRLDELLEYTADPTDPSRTILTQSATVNVHGVPLLASLLETVFVSGYSSTVSNGRQAMEEKSSLIAQDTS